MFDTDASLADGLDRNASRRLDRFAEAFERVDAHAYIQFAGEPPDSKATARAEANVLELIGTGKRRDWIRRPVEAFVESASRAYSNHLAVPLLLNDAVADRPEDRRRFLRNLERAVAALLLWDELDDDDRDTLTGPWAALIDRAVRP